jgi:hypothetical protein
MFQRLMQVRTSFYTHLSNYLATQSRKSTDLTSFLVGVQVIPIDPLLKKVTKKKDKYTISQHLANDFLSTEK